ncbi:hypothetical protein [Rhizomonospora bruguierae]|uniref:hypothetical protein n=1 Tax=Rhizomonospora bruguierae TaxID=1581705 RepID=UPI001BCFEEBB|nr:hypothetical protein [Micromonospora sp. NBRC 107566]
MVLAFDGPELTRLLPASASRSAAQLVTARHELLATLACDSSLSRLLDRFDSDRRAWLVVTDPLDPPVLGSRRHLGGKHPSWAMFEHKSTVDALWDAIGLARAESIVFDQPGRLLSGGQFAGVGGVASSQRRGAAPSAGGGDVRRWTGGRQPHAGHERLRVRLLPALRGTPCRLHGLVLPEATVAFPPLELLVPHRPDDGVYLCAGAWPLPDPAGLIAQTRWLGDRLRDRLAYRGGFSVDGILTRNGFRPTDLNTRITSVFEALPPMVRVAAHTAAIVARANLPGVDGCASERWFGQVFDEPEELVLRLPAPQSANAAELGVRWNGSVLEPAARGGHHGVIELNQGARGMVASIRLHRTHLPADVVLQRVAVAALAAADRLLGTGFGRLEPPRAARGAVPARRSGAA